MAIGSSFDSPPQRLLQEQHTTMPQCLATLPATDPVNNMIVHRVIYSTPEIFTTFQLILTHCKNEVLRKETGGGTTRRQYLTAVERKRFTRIKHIVRAYDRYIESHSTTASHEEVITRFQDYYSKSKHSFVKLADIYAKEILSE